MIDEWKRIHDVNASNSLWCYDHQTVHILYHEMFMIGLRNWWYVVFNTYTYYFYCSLLLFISKFAFVCSLRWISHIKDLLYKCCLYLEELKPESPLDMQSILIHLHTLVAFTATNTWALTRSKNFEKLRGGMTQLCANVMGSLFHKGYYLTLKVIRKFWYPAGLVVWGPYETRAPGLDPGSQ
jgi:hypothetical protein